MTDPQDEAAVAEQLGRPPRGIESIAHRCGCGLPDVVATAPRLPDGTPFPTTFYLTCPRAASRIGALEGAGVMAEMTRRLTEDTALSAAYRRAHERYLQARAELGEVPEIAGISAGGMPDRVKCLHVLAAQSLAQGRGVNPLGDEVLDSLGVWWEDGPCVDLPRGEGGARNDAGDGGARATRVAAVDCGTNTIKLLVVDLDPVAGTEEVLTREARMVRLGQGVDAAGRLSDEALVRVFDAVEEYSRIIERLGATEVRFCATSAVRDAANAEDFAEGVRRRMGVTPEVLTGAEEARLSFTGAVRGLADHGDDTPADGPVLVVDIGGGSTEVVLGHGVDRVDAAHSMDIGSVRMTERHLASDPPSDTEVGAAREAIEAELDALPDHGVRLEDARAVVAVSGTGLTVAAGAAGRDGLGHDIHGTTVTVAAVRDEVRRLREMTVAERRDLGYMDPGRADVIAAGALILEAVLERTQVDELRVSVTDILDGIAWSCVGA